MADNCALCGLSAKEHKNMERDKRRGFHAFSAADPKDQEREQAAREWLATSEHVELLDSRGTNELVSLLRTQEEAAYKRGQESCAHVLGKARALLANCAEDDEADGTGMSADVFIEACEECIQEIDALPIKGMEE